MASNTPGSVTKRSVGSVRERNGCLTCRQRKKKCDLAYPVCDQCTRLNYTCRREDPRVPPARAGRPRASARETAVTARQPATSTSSSCACVSILPTPNLASLWLQNGTGHDVSSRRVLLRYYTQSFTTLLTTTTENNCFLSVYLPMAMESPLLLDAIMAWSSTHLSLQDEAYKPIAFAQCSTALTSLATSLGSSNRNPEMELASCLVHCALESISGDTRQWFSHHVGAYEVIRSIATIQGTSSLDLKRLSNTFEGCWLLQSFAYHDIMMSITEGRKPLLVAGEYWLNSSNGEASTYFGFASQIMLLISETSLLNVDMEEPAAETSRIETFSESAHRIEQALVSWVCHASGSKQLVNLAEMYRSAALIHLYRTIRRHRGEHTPVTTAKIAIQVMEIVQRLQAMPAQCLAESSLLFPLFLAGGEAEDSEHIEVIRQRMRDIIKVRHFHNMDAVLEVLEELWHLRAIGVSGTAKQRVDWRDVLVRRKWMLSIT